MIWNASVKSTGTLWHWRGAAFANIAEQYRINLPDSEIGYIYDYISHDYSDESPWKNEF